MANNDDNNKRNTDKNLFYLNELSDYKVSSDDPDVRGWEVKDADDRVIGKVENLLVNKNTERVVYLDVEVDKSIIEAKHDPYRSGSSEGVHEFMNKDGEDHIIIPIGLVKLNDDNKFVYTDKVNHKTFAQTKRMKKGSNVNREYEKVVLESYNRDTNSSSDRNKTSKDKNAVTSERYKTSTETKADPGDRNKASKDKKADTGEHNKTPKDKNAVTGDRNKGEDRQKKLAEDTAPEKRNQRDKDIGDSDVSHTGATSHNKDSERGQIKDDFNPKNTEKTSFSSDSDRDSNPKNSGSEKSGTSKRDRENNNEEDFYNKKEFDDKNFRKKK
ncbi:PRC-barrel domain-containing protein [Salegentibacter sp. JZCK2]|uniref:PRC-barrel domain-containing protein n=1 Tax=Salegentibacter tibetensis TaxID=2873600 RepID=UPI001CCA24C1|nr:PRC-barrel domain-containing protein [Salegentibacter tibetensis]MBZ9729347.1 PRC-barrel domain-containing protein [Salegentibacter tibetensis]